MASSMYAPVPVRANTALDASLQPHGIARVIREDGGAFTELDDRDLVGRLHFRGRRPAGPPAGRSDVRHHRLARIDQEGQRLRRVTVRERAPLRISCLARHGHRRNPGTHH